MSNCNYRLSHRDAPVRGASTLNQITAVRKWITVVVTVLLGTLLFCGTLAAHGEGGQPQMGYVQLHPNDRYLHAWTSPAIPRAGEIHVEVLVTDQAFQPLGGQLFRVRVTSADGTMAPQQFVARPILTDDGAPTARHEVAFNLAEAGDYYVDISVVTASGMEETHRFSLGVIRVSHFVKVGLQAMLALLAVAGTWLVTQGIRVLFLR